MPIYFLGRVDSKLRGEHWLKSYAFVFLPDYEGLPISLMKAMTYGIIPICLRKQNCEILPCGVSVMHIANYKQTIAKSVPVSYKWCIFYTVAVMAKRTTTFLRKRIYKKPVVESIFNQAELEGLFAANELVIHHIFKSIPYDLSAVLGERTWTLTYLYHK